MPVVQKQEKVADETVKTSVLRSQSLNPAVQRLRSRVLANAEASEVITSYDRMHHRHNRS
ncbi:YhhA family cyclophane-containing RiPP [Ensifer sp. BR816]|uniref:YhhA family cyclophane-containing RiPP n=1 Tax=Rhizobium sp. (strain BR816) TaxID=1057002 RepID=UPI0003A97E24|nr:YhhA family cyclophane-containing RiPP [Ensifer sp. BR816]